MIFILLNLVIALLIVVYIGAMGVVKGISIAKARILVVAISLLGSTGFFAYHVILREREREYHDTVLDFMRSVEYSILSGRSADTARILHEQADNLAQHWGANWRIPYTKAVTEMKQLETNNDATQAAKDRAISP